MIESFDPPQTVKIACMRQHQPRLRIGNATPSKCQPMPKQKRQYKQPMIRFNGTAAANAFS